MVWEHTHSDVMTHWNSTLSDSHSGGNAHQGTHPSEQDPGLDAVETYFECITSCSLDDAECITVCTELLRQQS
jgi:hypothetical protein